jgi:4-azaleucine resistance transporter AzlC
MKSFSRSALALAGARDTIPLIIAALPFGIVFGATAISFGFTSTVAMLMSLIVFAGASQFIAITLLAAAASAPVILATVFIVNLRHMLYTLSLHDEVHDVPVWIRPVLAFWMTDESFATITRRRLTHPNEPGFFWYYTGSAVAMYSTWQVFTYIGIAAGERIPNLSQWGLDVAMVVAFVGIVVPLLKQKSHWACALTASVSAVITPNWPYQLGFLFSTFLAIAIGVIIALKKETGEQHA